MCKEGIEELTNSRSFYKEILDKLSDEKFLKNEGTTEQIKILEKTSDLDKYILENT